MVIKHFRYSLILLFAGLIFSCSESNQTYRWEILYDEQPELSFRGISAVSDSICWVSGSKGTILRTTDRGQTWQKLSVPGSDSLDFRDIEAFSADEAVTMSIGSGTQSRIYRTMDGGKNWDLVHQNMYDQGFYDAIAFWNDGYGILQGDPIEGRLFILVTDNRGQSWQEIEWMNRPAVQDGEYAFAASGTHMVTGAGGSVWIGTGGTAARVLYSNDYGHSWEAVSTPMIQGEASTGIFSMAFSDSSHTLAVGGDYTKEKEGIDNIIYSNDGGRKWNLLDEVDIPFRSAIRYTSGKFITVGPSGSEYSNDKGQSWHAIEGPGFHTLSIGSDSIDAVWAAGRDGKIARLVME